MKTLRISFTIAALLAAAACDNSVSGPTEKVGSVTVNPQNAALIVGETTALHAIVKTTEGRVLQGRTVTWSSENEAVATVTTSGMVTAMGAGTVIITAESDTRTGRATFTVQQPGVHEVVFLQASPVVLQEGGSMQLIAIARDAAGEDLNGYVPVWSSSDESVVWVSDTGGIVAGNAGTAQIKATVEGRSATLTVEVRSLVRSVVVNPADADVAVGGSTQLGATAYGAAGEPLGRTFAWETLDPAVATVDQTGTVTAHQPGVARITAAVAGVVGQATVRVGTVQSYRLESADGRPVPSHLYTSEIIDDEGIPRTVKVFAVFGQIRTLNQLYRQSITLEWYVGAVRVWVIEFTDRGRFFHDIFTGNLSFVSDTYPGLEYTGSLTNGGTRMSIDQQVDGDQPPFTFTFAKQ